MRASLFQEKVPESSPVCSMSYYTEDWTGTDCCFRDIYLSNMTSNSTEEKQTEEAVTEVESEDDEDDGESGGESFITEDEMMYEERTDPEGDLM